MLSRAQPCEGEAQGGGDQLLGRLQGGETSGRATAQAQNTYHCGRAYLEDLNVNE